MTPSKSDSTTARFSDYVKSLPLYVLPHHLVSAVIFKLTRMPYFKNTVIRWFVKQYHVDMTQAANSDIDEFETFNAFFTRALKSGARTIAPNADQIASPVDGTVSALGPIKHGRVFQAKGQDFSLLELLGGDNARAAKFANGKFMTIYLSPRDYHRIHMPLTGNLQSQTYVPGRLFSVAPHTVKTIPRLFARNERLVTIFSSDAGEMGLVLVGAINVSAIETVWDGLVTPPRGKTIASKQFGPEQAVSLSKGQEMGRFNMGSTVILLFDQSIQWDDTLATGSALQMGRSIGVWCHTSV